MSLKRTNTVVNEWSKVESDRKRLKPSSKMVNSDSSPGKFSFRCSELISRPDLHRDSDFLALWQRLSLSQRQRSDCAGIEPIKLPINSLDWTDWIKIDHDRYIGGGSFGDAYKGKWCNTPENVDVMPEVVVKVVRQGLVVENAEKTYKLIQREVAVWNAVRHENIVPFVGICFPRGREFPALISPWMKNGMSLHYCTLSLLLLPNVIGDVNFYLDQYPHIERETMLLGVARGLEFLHTRDPKIIHGDLKGANVLVNSNGQPCLIDFGISRMLSDQTLWHTSSTHAPGSLRWQAPELMDGTESTVTIKGDVYSFGMTCLEIMTGAFPFSEHKSDPIIFTAVAIHHKTPVKPKNVRIASLLWSMWDKCWSREVQSRPSMTDLVEELAFVKILTDSWRSFEIDVNYCVVLFLLIMGDSRAALETFIWNNPNTSSKEFRQAWLHLLPADLAQLIRDRWPLPDIFRSQVPDATEISLNAHLRDIIMAINAQRDQSHDSDGYMYALELAHRNGYYKFVRFLLGHPIVRRAISTAWKTAMAIAIRRDDCRAVPTLLGYIDASDQITAVYLNAIYNISQGGQIGMLKILLDGGADVTAMDRAGSTGLHYASDVGHREVAGILLENGAEIEARDRRHSTPLHLASRKGHAEVVELLLKSGADFEAKDFNQETSLHLALVEPYTAVVKSLLKYGANIAATNDYGMTALHYAAKSGQTEVVKLLLAKGSDIQATNDYGVTALHFASRHGHADVARLLLENDADITAKDKDGCTPLQRSTTVEHAELVELLLDGGMTIGAKNGYEMLARHCFSTEHTAVVKLLLERQAKLQGRRTVK